MKRVRDGVLRGKIGLVFVGLVVVGVVLAVVLRPSSEARTLRWLETTDPVALAEEACQAGDYRFIAVMGVGLQLPGVAENSPQEYKMIIPHTSDVLQTVEDVRINELARTFARRHNETVLAYLARGE